MKVQFYLRYATKFGESFSLCLPDGQRHAIDYLSDELWFASLDIDPNQYPDGFAYSYEFNTADGLTKPETNPHRRLEPAELEADGLEVYDFFNPMGLLENVFTTQVFSPPLPPHAGGSGPKLGLPDEEKELDSGGGVRSVISIHREGQAMVASPPHGGGGNRPVISIHREGQAMVASPPHGGAGGGFTHIFRTKAPQLKSDEAICILGYGKSLRNWDTAAPILLKNKGAWWETRLDLSNEDFPLGYKYGVWNSRTNKFLGFEEGGNRALFAAQSSVHRPPSTVHHDNFARLPLVYWKGAGVAIPVFSLRSEKSWGVGEFTDLHLLADWSKSVGLKLIQLLPINDTTATHTWTDSYPYASISAFALHPMYVNVEQVAAKKHAAVLKPFLKKRKELNALEEVDYEAVMQTKWEILRQLYDLQKAEWLKDADYQAYYGSNKHWLAPYAVFCWLRDANGSSDFNKWSKYSVYKKADMDKLLAPASKHFDQIGLHLFVQWHLHLQLKSAADYAHSLGLSLKGDIPIGIYRYSCDAWMAPELYDMNVQAGAPPDDFAEKGQNWGFPTYNWSKMKADGFAWWKQRFEQMSLYFDAFRIDHILGFFRIWSIPMNAVEGILGQFMPALPVEEAEFREAGVGFDYNRLCTPFITEAIIQAVFAENATAVTEQFLELHADGRFVMKPEFDTQRKVEDWMRDQIPNDFLRQLREGLFSLISNVVLLEAPTGGYAFRIGIEKTSSFQHLPEGVKVILKSLYVDYFYRRQDDFWKQEAMEKLPAIKAATEMLICGEDLGMVPGCVPEVMKELGILSLEIQRMPKAANTTFFNPKDAPYLSVVTPSTHDMSTLRGWWEEDPALTQRFYNEILQRTGEAPFYCEAWINKILLEQHFNSPAMWAIFQWQDLLGMDATLRRKNPHEERINIPANPKHYWRYRMHIELEDLMETAGFNAGIRKMVSDSGRLAQTDDTHSPPR